MLNAVKELVVNDGRKMVWDGFAFGNSFSIDRFMGLTFPEHGAMGQDFRHIRLEPQRFATEGWHLVVIQTFCDGVRPDPACRVLEYSLNNFCPFLDDLKLSIFYFKPCWTFCRHGLGVGSFSFLFPTITLPAASTPWI